MGEAPDVRRIQEQAEGELSGPDPLLGVPEQRMYDRVRKRVMETVKGKVPPRLQRAAELLLTLPDFVALIFRLMKDPRVPVQE